MSTEEVPPEITPLSDVDKFKQGYDELAVKDILNFLTDHPEKGLLELTLEYEKDHKKRPTVVEQCERLLSVVEKTLESEKKETPEPPPDAPDAAPPGPEDPSISTAKAEDPPKPPEGLVDPATLEKKSTPPQEVEDYVQIRIVQSMGHYPQIGKYRWIEKHAGRKPKAGETYRVPRFVGTHLIETHFAVLTY